MKPTTKTKEKKREKKSYEEKTNSPLNKTDALEQLKQYQTANIKKIQEEEEKKIEMIWTSFRRYKTKIFSLMLTYVFVYLAWAFISEWLVEYYKIASVLNEKDKHSPINFFLMLIVASFGSIFFFFDGLVASLIKIPFSQLCFDISSSKILTVKEKEKLFNRTTLANELCRETFKKFGVLAIFGGLTHLYESNGKTSELGVQMEKFGKYWFMMFVPYFFPCFIAVILIYKVNKDLKKIQILKKEWAKQLLLEKKKE